MQRAIEFVRAERGRFESLLFQSIQTLAFLGTSLVRCTTKQAISTGTGSPYTHQAFVSSPTSGKVWAIPASVWRHYRKRALNERGIHKNLNRQTAFARGASFRAAIERQAPSLPSIARDSHY